MVLGGLPPVLRQFMVLRAPIRRTS